MILPTKTFDLGTVLTVITGRVLTDMDNLHEILKFMTGESRMIHQFPRASDVCTKPLLAQFPKLAEIEVPEKFEGDDLTQAVGDWVATQQLTYGSTFEVEPLESWKSKNPLTELAEMMPDKPIMVVTE